MDDKCEKLELAAGTVLKYMGMPCELAKHTTVITNVSALNELLEAQKEGEAAQGDPASPIEDQS